MRSGGREQGPELCCGHPAKPRGHEVPVPLNITCGPSGPLLITTSSHDDRRVPHRRAAHFRRAPLRSVPGKSGATSDPRQCNRAEPHRRHSASPSSRRPWCRSRVKVLSPSSRHLTSTRPASTDSAPYLPILVASSWSARPRACAPAAFRRSFRACTAIRDPTRPPKCANGARTSSSTSDSLPLVPDQQVLIGCERPDALIKAPDKVFRLPRRGLAPACTRLSMFSAP
jgi:hypothetical protein